MLDTYVRIGKLPDDRWAAENAQNLARMTRADLEDIARAFTLWYELHALKLAGDEGRQT